MYHMCFCKQILWATARDRTPQHGCPCFLMYLQVQTTSGQMHVSWESLTQPGYVCTSIHPSDNLRGSCDYYRSSHLHHRDTGPPRGRISQPLTQTTSASQRRAAELRPARQHALHGGALDPELTKREEKQERRRD